MIKKFILLKSIIKSYFINLIFWFHKVIFIWPWNIISKKWQIKIWKKTIIYWRYRIELLWKSPKLSIWSHCSIAENLHLTCGKSIIIGDSVWIANNVTITDINHGYRDLSKPIINNARECKSVHIGSWSFIWCNVYIAPWVTIWEHCFIWANSVVLKSIGDYSIAVWSPAKVIKVMK